MALREGLYLGSEGNVSVGLFQQHRLLNQDGMLVTDENDNDILYDPLSTPPSASTSGSLVSNQNLFSINSSDNPEGTGDETHRTRANTIMKSNPSRSEALDTALRLLKSTSLSRLPIPDTITLDSSQEPLTVLREKGILPPQRMRSMYLLFFFAGICTSICYSSLLFQAPYYATCIGYGKDFLPFFSAAYNLPGLPLLFLQAKYDKYVDAIYGLARANSFRLTVSQIMMTVPLCILPWVPANFVMLISIVSLLSVFNASSYITHFSLASCFSPKCLGFFLVGTGFSTILLLILNLSTGLLCPNGSFSPVARNVYYIIVICISMSNLIWTRLIINGEAGMFYLSLIDKTLEFFGITAEIQKKRIKTFSRFSSKPHSQPFLSVSDVPIERIENNYAMDQAPIDTITFSVKSLNSEIQAQKRKTQKSLTILSLDSEETILLTNKQMILKLKFPLFVILFTLLPTYLLSSQLLRIPNRNQYLLQYIFYLDQFCNFIGRQISATRWNFKIETQSNALIFASLVRLGIVIYLFDYLFDSSNRSSEDVIFTILFVIYALSGGFLTTYSYVLSASFFSNKEYQNRAKASDILAIFAVSVAVLSSTITFSILRPLVY